MWLAWSYLATYRPYLPFSVTPRRNYRALEFRLSKRLGARSMRYGEGVLGSR